jgi:hypothetical protein
VIRPLQGRHIEQMRQRVAPSLGCARRSLHSLPKSRCHGCQCPRTGGSLLTCPPTRACLCSTGSGCHPVPRCHRSCAALRRPAPFGHGSGSPCRWPPSMRGRVLCLRGRRPGHPPPCRASETGHRLSAQPRCVEERRGPPGLRDRPLRACCGRTPRRICAPPCPCTQGPLLPSQYFSTLGIREDERFRGRSPPDARSHASASHLPSPGSAPGLLRARAGSPLAGQDLHLLDDARSFMVASHPPMLFDQPCLVALKFLYACWTAILALVCEPR